MAFDFKAALEKSRAEKAAKEAGQAEAGAAREAPATEATAISEQPKKMFGFLGALPKKVSSSAGTYTKDPAKVASTGSSPQKSPQIGQPGGSGGIIGASSTHSISSPGAAINNGNMTDLVQEDMAKFQFAMEGLRQAMDKPELVLNATRNILISLKEHPEFKQMVLPEDCQLMVRGLRESHGLVQTSKIIKTNKNKEKKKGSEENQALLDDLLSGNLDIEISTK